MVGYLPRQISVGKGSAIVSLNVSGCSNTSSSFIGSCKVACVVLTGNVTKYGPLK